MDKNNSKNADKTQKKINKIDTVKNNLFLLKQVHKASPGRIFFSLSVIILKLISNFLFDVYLLRFVINGIQTGISFRSILTFIIAVSVYHLGVCFTENYYYEIYVPVSDQKIYKYIQSKVFAKASSVETACFENPEFYDKYVKAVSEASGRVTQVLNTLCGIVNCIFTICTMSFIVFMIDPLLIAFAVLPFIISLIFGKRFNKIKYDYNMEMQEKSRRRDYVRRVFYLSDYAKEMRLTNINKVMFAKFYGSIKDLKSSIKKYGPKIGMLDYLFVATNDIVVYLGAILYASYKTLIAKTMLFGDCVIVINTINSVAWSLRGIVDILMQFHNNALYIENLKFFLEYEPAISENRNGLHVPFRGELKLKNVNFKYPGKEDYVLKNITMSIKPNEKIALVGHNGAGKSTLIKLIMRLYDVTEGQITLNDTPISEYILSEYRELFGTVFQNYKIFSLSVMDNVLLKLNPDEREKSLAVEGMKNSGIYDKVADLPKKEDTILTKEFDSEGAVLSGGECQKIAIARVFTKPCEIVILDEPSSALDPVSEYRMYESMMKACKNKAIIFISHRLSSAVLADKVYLLEDGRITEEGTHFELLNKNGKYADMWNKQAEKYIREDLVH